MASAAALAVSTASRSETRPSAPSTTSVVVVTVTVAAIAGVAVTATETDAATSAKRLTTAMRFIIEVIPLSGSGRRIRRIRPDSRRPPTGSTHGVARAIPTRRPPASSPLHRCRSCSVARPRASDRLVQCGAGRPAAQQEEAHLHVEPDLHQVTMRQEPAGDRAASSHVFRCTNRRVMYPVSTRRSTTRPSGPAGDWNSTTSVMRVPPGADSNRCSCHHRRNGPETCSSTNLLGASCWLIRDVITNGIPKCVALHVTVSPSPMTPESTPPTTRSPESLIDAVCASTDGSARSTDGAAQGSSL